MHQHFTRQAGMRFPKLYVNMYIFQEKRLYLYPQPEFTNTGSRLSFLSVCAGKIHTAMETINLESISQYNDLYGFETLHPLVTVVDLRNATKALNDVQINYGLYAIFLKMYKTCDLHYGRRPYDYQDGTIVSFAPGQSVTVTNSAQTSQPVIGLLFHPDLIHGTSLGKNIRQYSFFSYASNEALHLSEEEKQIFLDCLSHIRSELKNGTDKHSKSLIIMNIELALNYCMRFYERQFITREKENNDILVKFEELIDNYFNGKSAETYGLPTVKYFADKICLSPNYFGDLVKKITGKTAQDYIQGKVIDFAKERILGSQASLSEIAYSLGFQYPQHMSRLFKKKVGCTPNEYRFTKN